MKKHFLWACMAITALLMGACAEEDTFKAHDGNTVTFDVTIPEMAAATRAVGDGLTATTLYWGVYDHKDVLLQDISNTTTGQSFSKSTKVTLTLAQDKRYSIIFWAANDKNSMCTVDWENRMMTVNPTEANQESYDAFCKYEVIENVNGYMTRDVKLKRPFAQLNIGTADIAKAAASGLTVTNTKVEIAGLHTTYDFVTGNSEGEATFGYRYPENAVSFAEEAFPIEDDKYDYLSMNYALIGADKKLVDVTFAYLDDDGQEHTRTYSSVPVQRNWRTNIYGNILTSEADFTVTIVPEFDGAHNIKVWDGKSMEEPMVDAENPNTLIITTADQLAWLAASVNGTLSESITKAEGTLPANSYKGYTIKLGANIDLGNEQWTPIGIPDNNFEGNFNGDGFVISNLKIVEDEAKEGKAYIGLFGYARNATINNVTFENVNINIPCLDIEHSQGHIGAVVGSLEGTSTIENVTVKGDVKVYSTQEANGASRVAVVAGGNAYGNVTMKNVHVKANEGSYLIANNNTGALAGQLQGECHFENCSSNIDVTVNKFFAGGIIGLTASKSTFTNCHTTGDVAVVAGREGRANDHYRVGGIAGGWSDGPKNTCVLTNCSYTGRVSGKNSDGSVAEPLDYDGYVGRGYVLTNCAGSTVTIDGINYVQAYNDVFGIYLVDGVFEVATVAHLQKVLDNATGDIAVSLVADMVGDVMEHQKAERHVVIEGNGKKYDGTVKIHSGSNYNNGTITIKNVNFETATPELNFVMPNDFGVENGVTRRYSNNVTVDGCTFTATGDAVNTAVGVQAKSTNNVQVLNCTATDMHSLLQAQSCGTDVIVKNATINGKNGVAFKQVKNAVVEGTSINTTAYGIRFDGNISNYGITVKDNDITAVQPLIVRKMTGSNNTIKLEGNNTFTTESDYQIVITNGSDDEEYVKPTGTYTLTGADNYTVFPEPVEVTSWDEFIEVLNAGETDIKLAADITYDKAYELKKDVKINLNGKSLEISNPSLMLSIHSKATILNGTIKGKVYARKNADIMFDGVTFGGSINGSGSIEGLLQVQGACDVYAKDCNFNATNSNAQKSRPLSVEARSSGTLKFENCSFKSNINQNQVYVNTLSGTATLDFTNCDFNNKTPNIMFAATHPLTSLTMDGTIKLSSVTLEINRAKDAVTDTDLAYLRTMINNNSFSSIRVFYAGGSDEYIR